MPHRALVHSLSLTGTRRESSPQRHRYLFVRSALPSAVLTTAIRRAVTTIDRHQPLTSVKTMDEVIGATTAPRRFNTLLLGVFAAMALLLAVLGIY